MERESFEDQQVADVLNRSFISIKVDREERPDVDHIYMSVCQALTGHGGWPLTVFMAPDQKPFFTGTYFPKTDRGGMTGFLHLLGTVSGEWQTNREALLKDSSQILDAVQQTQETAVEELDRDLPDLAFLHFKKAFDQNDGGFGGAPKFPSPHNLMFLLRYWHTTKEKSALAMVEKTLDSMYRGGIYDHIGYGFSRYSTDQAWLVPHFEKMLYDNALLAIVYLEAYQATKNQKYADIARQIFTYVLRDMTSQEGGFYSAEDADSEGVEGKFYVWRVDEVASVLGESDAKVYCKRFDISEQGNFEGENIPNLIHSSDGHEEFKKIEEYREKLFQHREKRIHPHKDDKILTAWNGLMMAALAIGGRVLDSREYTAAAQRCEAFLAKNLIREDGRLLARYRDGHAAFPGYADDYAFLIWGLIELYETTCKATYLERAIALNNDLFGYFWDERNGGLFVTGSDAEQLIMRSKEIYDGAMPSGNSVSALNCLRLARLTGQSNLETKADEILKSFSGSIQGAPRGHAFALMALQFSRAKTKEIVIVEEQDSHGTQQLLGVLNNSFLPFALWVLSAKGEQNPAGIMPFIREYTAVEGKPTAYVCENFACKAPVTDVEQFKSMLVPNNAHF